MKFDAKDLFSALSHLKTDPALTVSVLALLIPVFLLFCAAQFSASSVEALVFFGILGVSVLVYSAWVVVFINGGRDAD